MMYLGDFAAGDTVQVPFNTSAGAGGSITIATNGTLKVYRLPGVTERTSAAGITFIEDHDTVGVGRHLVTIDLADNTDAGFYVSGNDFGVVRDGMVIDGQTVNVWLAIFSIENRSGLRPTTARRTLDVNALGQAATDAAVPPTVGEIWTEGATRTIAGAAAVGIVNDVAALVVTKHWAAASRTLTSLGTFAADVWAATTRTLTTGVGATAPTAAENATAVWNKVIETQGNITAQQALDTILAIAAGQTGDTGLTFKTPNGGTVRVVATVNALNERTSITLTPAVMP